MLRNKKYLLLIPSLLISSGTLSSCGVSDSLLFLNWGEYISEDLLKAFEEKYHINVIVDIADSNELFYAKIQSGTTKYDLCCPSDYMIEKMYLKKFIQKIDFTKLDNYKENIFVEEVYRIMNSMNDSMKIIDKDYIDQSINSYHIPYFWGFLGFMYNKLNPYFIDIDNSGSPDVFERNNAYNVIFDDSRVINEDKMPESLRVGMYNVVRFSYAAAMISDRGDPNAPLTDETAKKFDEILSRHKYTLWGSDILKHSILYNNLDFAFNYSGDFLDIAYSEIKEGKNFEDLNYGTYTPNLSIANIDSLVIPTGARHIDMAYKFIDFLLDPVNEYLNARNVGYCAPLRKTYEMIVNKELPDLEKYPYAFIEQTEEEKHWIDNWSKAYKTVFPVNEDGYSPINGIPLSYFDSDSLKILNNIVNNIKTR